MQQLTLFSEYTPVLPITYYPDFLSLEQGNELYQHCLKLEWQQNQIRILGKTLPVPHLKCIYGDAGCDYLYSVLIYCYCVRSRYRFIPMSKARGLRLAFWSRFLFIVVISNGTRQRTKNSAT
ncbi:MAG: hypothetical protein RMZ41_022395 [Nostoc sp. DedVER02]|uniref:hypothetical protein n=1 Tax=unclassified Nostoc TaxID=2593658 RepID=UPI002AD5A3F1|nr:MULTISPECIES: hypothetical protein [unclassified Nostoc]MDZ7987438.1 hypothetical protein [Nostoc sp. DedVER02]MDZ8116672.1 hypothetical protein [Nostoc sp. DedVER01b]